MEWREDLEGWRSMGPLRRARCAAGLLSVCALAWALSWVAAAYL